ncbi:hypothetical protein [Thermaerobacter litoralis]
MSGLPPSAWLLASLLVLAAGATALMAAAAGRRLAAARLVRPNYRGRPVVTGAGVALLAGPLAVAALAAVLAALPPGTTPPASGAPGTPTHTLATGPSGPGEILPAGPGGPGDPGGRLPVPAPLGLVLAAAPSLLALVAATALVGLVDDLLDEPVRGWRGHLAAGAALTGGRLKLLALPLLAFALAPGPGPGLAGRVLAAGLVAAAANGMNLLDRRPGRALKAFFAAWLALAAALPPAALALLPVAVAALVLLPLDLEERAMLGDAGSNALGAALGWAVVTFAPPAAQGTSLVALLLLHLVGEFYSLSRLIDAVPPLRWLDRLGTRPSAPAPWAGPQGSSWSNE